MEHNMQQSLRRKPHAAVCLPRVWPGAAQAPPAQVLPPPPPGAAYLQVWVVQQPLVVQLLGLRDAAHSRQADRRTRLGSR